MAILAAKLERMRPCERCGSIQVTKRDGELTDRLVEFATGRQLFVCMRCGWKGRRSWNELLPIDRSELAPAGDQASDPMLASLDSPRIGSARRSKRRRSRTNGPKAASEFDLAGIRSTLKTDDRDQQLLGATGAELKHSWAKPRSTMARRRRRKLMREVGATIAIVAFAMFLFAVLGLADGCSGNFGAP
jgi:hypothetical protein